MAKAPDGKIITINVEKTGALIVGDDAKVAISMDGDVAVGTTIGPKGAVKIDGLIKEIATARGASPDEIKSELAKSLEISDLVMLTGEKSDEALKILSVWKERLIREVVNERRHE